MHKHGVVTRVTAILKMILKVV